MLFLLSAGSGAAGGIIIRFPHGFLSLSDSGFYAAGLLYLCFLILSSALMLLKPEISLLYHGKRYYSLSDLPYRPSLFAVSFINSFLLCAVIMCAGIFTGAGLLLMGKRTEGDRIALISIAILYTQILASVNALVGPYAAIAVALLFHLVTAPSHRAAKDGSP
jgi:hypothetical protein